MHDKKNESEEEEENDDEDDDDKNKPTTIKSEKTFSFLILQDYLKIEIIKRVLTNFLNENYVSIKIGFNMKKKEFERKKELIERSLL